MSGLDTKKEKNVRFTYAMELPIDNREQYKASECFSPYIAGE